MVSSFLDCHLPFTFSPCFSLHELPLAVPLPLLAIQSQSFLYSRVITSLKTLFYFRVHWFAGIICTITPCFSLWNSLKASPGWPPVSFALQRTSHAVVRNPSTYIWEFLSSCDLSPNSQLLKHEIRSGGYKSSLAGEMQTKPSPGQDTTGIHPTLCIRTGWENESDCSTTAEVQTADLCQEQGCKEMHW